jgi:hypothetical protein
MQVLMRLERAMDDAVSTLPAPGQAADAGSAPNAAPPRSVATAAEAPAGQQSARRD